MNNIDKILKFVKENHINHKIKKFDDLGYFIIIYDDNNDAIMEVKKYIGNNTKIILNNYGIVYFHNFKDILNEKILDKR